MNLALALKLGPWIAILALLGVIAVQSDHISGLNSKVEACTEGRKADAESYKAAQAQAQANNLEHVTTVEDKQRNANDAQIRTLNSRLEQLRRELRAQAGTPQSHPNGPGVPEADRGPAPSGEAGLCLTPEELLHGASNEERHDELITLVEQAMKLLNEGR